MSDNPCDYRGLSSRARVLLSCALCLAGGCNSAPSSTGPPPSDDEAAVVIALKRSGIRVEAAAQSHLLEIRYSHPGSLVPLRPIAHKIESLYLPSFEPSEGDIAALSSMVHLRSLQTFHIEARRAAWLDAVQGLSELRRLTARLSEAELEQIGRSPMGGRLSHLSVTGAVTDAGCAMISQMQQLEGVELDARALTAAGLREVCRLPRLMRLGLSFARTESGDLKAIASCKGLQYLAIEFSDVSKDTIVAITSLADLRKLSLYGSEVYDDSVEALGRMKQLELLWIENTGISDEGCRRLAALLPATKVIGTGGTCEPATSPATK